MLMVTLLNQGSVNMVHKIKSSSGKQVEWGFDLTEVESDEVFMALLSDFGFKYVSSQKPTDKPYPDSPSTNEMGMKGRFTSFHDTFANPSGIRITVEHMGGRGGDKGFLGYIGVKAPASADAELQKFLVKFRGKRRISSLDWSGKRGIARYVKEENAYDNPYITVR